MKLFTIGKDGKFVPYKEQDFKAYNKEIDLEGLLESNPEYFFEQSKILIIGRQVITNFNKFIDLLGVDKYGNTVVIELKREKTPRETIAQLIEYASFVDNLDYEQLNEIFQNYTNEETELENFHKEFFGIHDESISVSWNKSSKLVVVAQEITPEIKQTSLYLRKKGVEIYCMEFKYFINESNNRIISSDFVIGDENFIKQKISSNAQLPKTTKEIFFSNLDDNGKIVFSKIFEFIDRNNLKIRWGSKGFSANVKKNTDFIGIFFGWPLNSAWGQVIATGFGQIAKKLENSQPIIDYYKSELEKLKLFNKSDNFFSSQELKWDVTNMNDYQINRLIKIFEKVADLVKKELDRMASAQQME
mgnify:CR=1 FL=1